jgi:hypothetical protein
VGGVVVEETVKEVWMDRVRTRGGALNVDAVGSMSAGFRAAVSAADVSSEESSSDIAPSFPSEVMLVVKGAGWKGVNWMLYPLISRMSR